MRDSRQAHRAACEGNPVIEHAESDYLKGKRRNDEVIVPDAEGGDANQRPKEATEDDRTDDVDQERAVSD